MMSCTDNMQGYHSTFTQADFCCWAALIKWSEIWPKYVLTLTDAIFVKWSGGPGGSPDGNGAVNKIIATKDVVANDYQCLEILKTLGLDNTRRGFAETVIRNAALAKYSIGTNDPNQMDVVNITSPYNPPVSVTAGTSRAGMNRFGAAITGDKTRPKLEFTVSGAGGDRRQVSVTVTDLAGHRVATVFQGMLSSGHQTMSLANHDGLAAGSYVVALTIDNLTQTLPLSIYR